MQLDLEVAAANSLLDKLDWSVKKCAKWMIGGNHEARYERFRINAGMLLTVRRMKGFRTWHEEYNLLQRGWEFVEYGGHLQIGKCIFTHGWFVSGGSAKKMAECFPGRNVIFGHTHQHLIYGCMDERGLPIESESIGTLSRFDLSYLKGKPPINWIHSFCYIDMLDDGTFTKHYVRIIDGKFVEYGKLFG